MKLIQLKNLKRECVLVELPDGHTLEDYVSGTDEVVLPNLLGKFNRPKRIIILFFDKFTREVITELNMVYDPIKSINNFYSKTCKRYLSKIPNIYSLPRFRLGLKIVFKSKGGE